jgi:rubrerythrin
VLTRKRFLAVSGAAGAAALTGCGGDADEDKKREREARLAVDREIVGLALLIEQAEVAFYDQVVEQASLADIGGAGLAAEIMRNERAHLEAMQRWARRLGAPTEKPKTDFAATFQQGAEAVAGMAGTLENLSAAAYLGQLNRIQDSNLLATALAIHSVEGRQAAAVNRLAGRTYHGGSGARLEGSIPDGAFAEPLNIGDVRARLKRLGVEPR